MDRMGWAAATAGERVVDVPGRGRTRVWDCPGPPGAPTLVLLHGVTLTAELNWFGVVDALRSHYRVITWDQRGHGDAWSSPLPFRLEDCADDVAAVLETLGVRQAIAVGYSMGGFVAQLFWRRHPEFAAGLVLCASTRNVLGSAWERYAALLLPSAVAALRFIPMLPQLQADLVGAGLLDRDTEPLARDWALSQMSRTSLVTALSAVQAASEFTSHRWIGSIDVPTAVIVTRNDRIVPPRRQWKLVDALPDCVALEIDGDHGAFLKAPSMLAEALLRAGEHVCTSAASYDGTAS